MKNLLFLSVCALMITSCGSNSKKPDPMKLQNDSLIVELSNRDAELDEIMGSFNEIQESFDEINKAENRVDLQKGSIKENSSSAAKIKDDIHFISEKMKQNREEIAKLQQLLKNSRYNSAQLKKAIESLTTQLEEKQKQIESLQAELASKNIRIDELDQTVTSLNKNVDDLTNQNNEKAATVASQDKALNAAWFVFGTKTELKDQKILYKGDLLTSGNFNKDYFTQIDIRKDKVIKLYSKYAKLLTTHPAGSYSLTKDANGQYILKIINPTEFWSVSRYLVVLVK